MKQELKKIIKNISKTMYTGNFIIKDKTLYIKYSESYKKKISVDSLTTTEVNGLYNAIK